jgi:hypothetical protein
MNMKEERNTYKYSWGYKFVGKGDLGNPPQLVSHEQ